jgi:hypothetical protein
MNQLILVAWHAPSVLLHQELCWALAAQGAWQGPLQ